MKSKQISIIIIIILSLYIASYSNDSLVFRAAKDELNRSITELKKQANPPYFISYSITDIQKITISASFGKLENDLESRTRTLGVDLRVGDYKFDNTHIIRGSNFSFSSNRNAFDLPIENSVDAIRTAIWYATDAVYKKAVERYEKAITNKAVKVAEEDTSADFSQELSYKYFEASKKINVNKEYWKQRIRKLSELFSIDPLLYDGNCTFQVELVTKYFVSSEGTEVQTFEPAIRLFITATTKAEDGMSLPLYKSYFAFEPELLPSEEVMKTEITEMMNTLANLRKAHIMQTFSGPAILSGEASGVFFHEIFGHRAEGHRQKDPNSSQTFKNFLDKKILPDFIDVVFDPTIKDLDGNPLSGYYLYDDEGIKSQKVLTVDGGIFKNFLMCRSPIDKFSHSNGHGRRQTGFRAVSRQSNLIIIAKETIPAEKLKDMLREECKKQNKDYGLYFKKVQSGFTFTGTSIPNAFNVNPLVVYKVFADGSPDELVRGVDLIGTPLTTFSNIIAAGNDLGVFNGICGAESGGVPVSASSPSLLVSLIEVQKKAKSQAKLPILPSPITKP